MSTRTKNPLSSSLGQAVALGAWIAVAPGVTAQEPAVKPAAMPAPVQQQDATAAQEPFSKPEQAQKPPPVRSKVTGSSIARVRTDRGLPLLVLDRGYIDQSGATTSTELIQTIPQAQNFHGSGAAPSGRH
jgi:iron complex outermembrane receptor protein